MTDSSRPSRPQQVTTAVVISVAACVLAVVNLFSTREELRGTSFRDSLTEAQEQAGGLGASNEQLVTLLEVLVFVSGALAAAAAVLAIYAWQGNRAAWIGFFVLAALLAFTLPVAGVLPVLLLASGATFLASRPARDWFAGRSPAAASASSAAGSSSGSSSHVSLSQDRPDATPGGSQPPPYPGRFGGGSTALPPPDEKSPAPGAQAPSYGHDPGYGNPYAPPAPAPAGHPFTAYGAGPSGYGSGPDKRPGTVTVACALTWLGAFLVTALIAVVSLFLAADRTTFLREFQRQADAADLDVTQDQVLAITWTVVGIGLFWCLAATVLAVLAFRRSRGARIGLAVSAAMTVLVSLLLILSFVSVVPLLLGIAVLVLLFTGGANDWYARRSPYPSFQGPYQGGPFQGGPPAPYSQQQPPYGQQPPPPTGRQGPW